MKVIFEDKNSHLTISSTVKRTPKLDRALFCSIKNKVLGREYELGVVFVGKQRGRALNFKHRGKDYATDILSFPLDKENGEIFINAEKTKSKSKEFDRTFENYLPFIFIHGLFHLKGYDHSSTMESKEAAVRALFKI